MTDTTTPRQSAATMYLACRTLGHAWEPIPAEKAGALGGDPMWLRCMRCLTERHDSVSWATGELMARKYEYPDGYRHAFDTSFADAVPTRNDFRRMMLTEQIARARETRAANFTITAGNEVAA